MALARPFADDARAVAGGERCRVRIDRDDDEAGELVDRAQRPEHVLEHDSRERAAFLGAQAGREPLLRAVQLLDRHDGEDAGHATGSRPRSEEESASAALSTTRASSSRSSRLVMSVRASVTLGTTCAASAASSTSIT